MNKALKVNGLASSGLGGVMRILSIFIAAMLLTPSAWGQTKRQLINDILRDGIPIVISDVEDSFFDAASESLGSIKVEIAGVASMGGSEYRALNEIDGALLDLKNQVEGASSIEVLKMLKKLLPIGRPFVERLPKAKIECHFTLSASIGTQMLPVVDPKVHKANVTTNQIQSYCKKTAVAFSKMKCIGLLEIFPSLKTDIISEPSQILTYLGGNVSTAAVMDPVSYHCEKTSP